MLIKFWLLQSYENKDLHRDCYFGLYTDMYLTLILISQASMILLPSKLSIDIRVLRKLCGKCGKCLYIRPE